jgi:glycosyltransferase involved in cell wall biosynthesis
MSIMNIIIVDMPFYHVTRNDHSDMSMSAGYQAEAFASNGHIVTVVTACDALRRVRRVGREPFTVVEIPLVHFRGSIGKLIFEMWYSIASAFKILGMTKQIPCVILYHSYPSCMTGAVLGIFHRVVRRGIVVQHAGLEDIDNKFMSVLSTAIKRFALPRAQLVLTQSAVVRDALIFRFGLKPKAVVVLPIVSGIDTLSFSPRPVNSTLRKRIGISTDDGVLLCVGAISRRKNQLSVVHALRTILKSFPRSKLILLGMIASESYYNQIEKVVKMNNLEANVIYVGFVRDYSELPDYYNLADVFILVSLYEGGLPRAVMEAMSCGKPCIISRLKFNTEYITSREALLVDPMDDDSISTAVIGLLGDERLRDKLGVSAREKMQGYSWREITSKCAELFESLNLGQ